MIVKFHPRGRGGGAGPVDYLLGKDRQRDGATVLQGKPEEVRELIDASPYVKKYTSGVLSFAEQDLPPGQREKLMASFERVLMLEKAGRVGDRLRGMADDVWSYATGERGAERARFELEQAGAEFERSAAPVVERLKSIEAHRQQERAAQHQKALELDLSQRQKTYDGPSLG